MRLVSIIVEDRIGNRVYRAVRKMTSEVVDNVAFQGELLRAEYRIARREVDGLIDKDRTAGPKGPLP